MATPFELRTARQALISHQECAAGISSLLASFTRARTLIEPSPVKYSQ